MKVFISGKISGLPKKEYESNFFEAEYFLKIRGYEVVNPLEICKDIHIDDYSKQLGRCIWKLISCDAIYMLSNWKDSKGAMIENYTAITLGKEIMFESDGYKQQ